MNSVSEEIKVYKVLNTRPKLFIFPVELFLPFAIIASAVSSLHIFLGLEIPVVVSIIVGLCAGWWILVGEKSYKFTDKLIPLPGTRYYNLNTFWVVLLQKTKSSL